MVFIENKIRQTLLGFPGINYQPMNFFPKIMTILSTNTPLSSNNLANELSPFKENSDKTRLFFMGCNIFWMINCTSSIWVFHVRSVWRIFVRLPDRFKVTQHKINFVKKCLQWSLNPRPLDHQSHALLTELGRNLLDMSEVSFLLFHAPPHMLDFVYF